MEAWGQIPVDEGGFSHAGGPGHSRGLSFQDLMDCFHAFFLAGTDEKHLAFTARVDPLKLFQLLPLWKDLPY